MVLRRETLVMVFRSAAPDASVLPVSLLSGVLGWIFLLAMAVFLSGPATPVGPTTPSMGTTPSVRLFPSAHNGQFPQVFIEFGSAPGSRARYPHRRGVHADLQEGVLGHRGDGAR